MARPSASTPERDALLGQLWKDPAVTTASIVSQMNALPGPAIAGPTTLGSMAERLGLGRGRAVRPSAGPARQSLRSSAAAGLHGLSGVRGSSLLTAAGGAGLPAKNTDQEDAERLFASGMRPRQVARELMLEDRLGDVSNWFFAWQRTQPSDQRAA